MILELPCSACIQLSLLCDFSVTSLRPRPSQDTSSPAQSSGPSSLTYFEFSGFWASEFLMSSHFHPALPGTYLLPSCYLLRSDLNFQVTLVKLAVHWNHLGNFTLRGYGPGGLRTQRGRICISNKLPDDSETVSLWAHFDEYTFKVQFKTPVFQEI